MSRCFPFPPPGYEKKPTSDDTDSLRKEKCKEKKHKKDKREREKREGKEKRDKDRSDGKQREKKDRREKHRDKKKDKEKDRDKDKGQSSTSEEKRVGGQLEGYNGEKPRQKEEPGKGKSSCSDDKKASVQFWAQNGDKPVRNSIPAEDTEDSKFVQELGRRIRDEEKGTSSNQIVEGFTVADWKKDDGINRFAVRDIAMQAEGKNKVKRVDSRKMDEQRIRDEASFGGNGMVQNLAGMDQNKTKGAPAQLDKKSERRIEEKDKSREREGGDKRGDKRKNKDQDKQSHGKDKDKDKDKKEEKAKEKSQHKKAEKNKIKHLNKSDPIGAINNKSSHPSKDSNENAATEGNLKKRKEMETNGFSHDNEPKPNKMSRSASHVLTENGRKLEPYQIPSPFPSDKLEASANNHKVDNKEHKINGIIVGHMSLSTKKSSFAIANQTAAQPLPISKTKPSSSTANQIVAQPLPVSITKPSTAINNQIAAPSLPVSTAKPSFCKILPAEASVKRPHPDTKHLSQILTVPKMEPWSDFDDQEWLFSKKYPPSKKSKMGAVGVNEELQQVWAEAFQIGSVDVCALPYVIPY